MGKDIRPKRRVVLVPEEEPGKITEEPPQQAPAGPAKVPEREKVPA